MSLSVFDSIWAGLSNFLIFCNTWIFNACYIFAFIFSIIDCFFDEDEGDNDEGPLASVPLKGDTFLSSTSPNRLYYVLISLKTFSGLEF